MITKRPSAGRFFLPAPAWVAAYSILFTATAKSGSTSGINSR